MPDVFTNKKRSEVMSRIRSKDTKPEITLRKVLHRQGLRFRLHVNTLPGKPDIVLPIYRTVIQVRGCFWHGHDCIDGHIPRSRQEYWEPKLLNNKRRDTRNDKALRRNGWSVIVVWECTIQSQTNLEREVNRIFRILSKK
ncbi:MAG: DNA mismatch endonuclease Vsr [Nitrospirae bacterium]|nr:DNA mismatch endonuclease Vsr [Nitrospirota bacterium]